jgi:hypothetical protein
MDFENFSIARDLLFLAGAFVGIALGYLLSLFRKDIAIHSRNRRITLLLLFFSGAVVAFAAAIIVSHGSIFGIPILFISAAVGIPIFALAVRFPRAAAFPLILAGGLFIVWLGFSYLRFPLIKSSSVPVIFNDGAGSYSIKFPASYGDRAALSLPASQSLTSLEFQGTRISFGSIYPVIGGTERGEIRAILRDGEFLYRSPLAESPLLRAYYSLLASAFQQELFSIAFQDIEGKSPVDAIPEGANLTVSFDKDSLLFNPSWKIGR